MGVLLSLAYHSRATEQPRQPGGDSLQELQAERFWAFLPWTARPPPVLPRALLPRQYSSGSEPRRQARPFGGYEPPAQPPLIDANRSADPAKGRGLSSSRAITPNSLPIPDLPKNPSLPGRFRALAALWSGMSTPKSRIFTIDVDGKPTVVFEASSWSEARELSQEEWFRADLSVQMSGGVPLSTATSNYRARYALSDEITAFEQHRMGRKADDLELVYLVELDEG
jgi:hypothetical protein